MTLSHMKKSQSVVFPFARPAEVKNTLAGIVDALSTLPEWAGVLATNQLDQRIVFLSEPPFGAGDLAGQAVRDRDVDRIRLWFEDATGTALTKGHVVDAVRIVADRHAFHPVRQYLEGLSWDGVPRIDGWLERFAAVVPESDAHARLVRSVARKWLVSCVARAMTPGCKVDTMLILEGRQGIGKSTALSVLAGQGLHCDSAIDFATKDACQLLQGVWIFELAELDAILRRDPSTIKAFLSRSYDRFRVPYGRAPESVPRSVVFCGTVNHGGYLRDSTGNRRFWVVRCEGPLDTEGLRATRDALWAEAVEAFRRGENWHLDAEREAGMRAEHEARLEEDPWEEVLAAWTAARTDLTGALPFSMSELLDSALGLPAHSRNPRVTSRVNGLLARLGYEKRKRGSCPRTYFYARRSTPKTAAILRPEAEGPHPQTAVILRPEAEGPHPHDGILRSAPDDSAVFGRAPSGLGDRPGVRAAYRPTSSEVTSSVTLSSVTTSPVATSSSRPRLQGDRS
jgi:putative DNA primase/helicase